MWANEEHISAFNRENPELNIVDVLNYEAETVVKDISVGELLGKIKNMAYVPEKQSQNVGDMHMYQQT